MHPPAGFLHLRGRANVAVALLIVTALVSALSILYELDMRSLIDRIAAGQPVGLAEVQTADDRTTLVAMLSLGALVATGIAFVAWFFRAYVNIERLGARDLRATKGWSIGAWFVPLLNLVRPKQIMDDIWRASDPALPAGELRGWQRAAVPGLLHGWWAAFLIAGVIANISGQMLAGAETPAARHSAGQISMIGDAGMIAAAVLAVLVIRAVTSRQEDRAARVGPGSPPAEYTPLAVQYSPALDFGEPDRPHSFPPPSAA
ncbi:MAG: hypothetical protein QOJ89_70 [bacterium]|jgi:hypothetical protein